MPLSRCLLLGLPLVMSGVGFCADPAVVSDHSAPLVMNVWPTPEGLFPGEARQETPESRVRGEQFINVSVPTLTVYRPAPEKALGVAMIISPGGGYTSVYANKEGEQPAKWLVERGFTAILLKYRVPNLPQPKRYLKGMQDLQRSVSLVRAKARELGVDPNRIGLIGFSAGGQMMADVATNFTPEGLSYPSVDEIDKVSSRPDFVVMAYPGGLANRGATAVQAPEIKLTNQAPPMFIAIGSNDSNGSENGAVFYLALLNAGVKAELHIYQDVGHGFGLVEGSKPINSWQDRMMDWLKLNQFLQRTDVANSAGHAVSALPIPPLAAPGTANRRQSGGASRGTGAPAAPAPATGGAEVAPSPAKG